jgi:hypothetical protein
MDSANGPFDSIDASRLG